MKEVINKLLEAHEDLTQLTTQAKDALNSVLAREASCDKREKLNSEKEADLRTRESNVSKTENVIELKKQADETMNSAQDLMEKATTAQKQLDINTKIASDKINDLKTTVAREQDNVDKRKKEMDDEVSRRVDQCLINMGIKVKKA